MPLAGSNIYIVFEQLLELLIIGVVALKVVGQFPELHSAVIPKFGIELVVIEECHLLVLSSRL